MNVARKLSQEAATYLEMFQAWELERRALSDRMFRLEALLEEHGIAVPDDDRMLGGDSLAHQRECMGVVVSAYELLRHLDELKRIIGSGMEFVRDQPPWREEP